MKVPRVPKIGRVKSSEATAILVARCAALRSASRAAKGMRIKKRAEEADKRDRETLSPEDLCAIEYLTEHGEFLPDDPRRLSVSTPV